MFFNKNNNKFYDEKISQAQGISSSYSHGITSDYIKIDKNKYFNTLKIANDNNFEISSFGGYTSNNLSFKKKIYDKYTKVNIFEKNVNSYINEKLNYITIGSYENLLFLLSATGNSKHDLALKTKKWIDNINDKKEEAINLYLSSNNSETKDIDIAHFLSNPNVYTLSSLFDEGYTFSTNNDQQFGYSPLVIDLNRGGFTGITGSCSVGLTSNFELTFQPNSNNINSITPNNTQNIYILGMEGSQNFVNILADIIQENEIQDSDLNGYFFSGHNDYPFPIITLGSSITGIGPIINQETLDATMNAIYSYNGITFSNPYTIDDIEDYFEERDGWLFPTTPFERHIKPLLKGMCGDVSEEELRKYHPGFGPTSVQGEQFGDTNGDGIIDDNETFNDNYPVIFDIFVTSFANPGNFEAWNRLRSIFWNTLSSCCEFTPSQNVDWWSENNPCGIIAYKECCKRDFMIKLTASWDFIGIKGSEELTRDFPDTFPLGMPVGENQYIPWETCEDYNPPNQGGEGDCDCPPEQTESTTDENVINIKIKFKHNISGECVLRLLQARRPDVYEGLTELEKWSIRNIPGGIGIIFIFEIKGVCSKTTTTVRSSKCGCPSCPCDKPECQGTTPPCEDKTIIISLLKDKDLNYDASESIII